MVFNAYTILVVISCLVILSYLFSFLSEKLRIPSVLLLIAVGIGLQFLSRYAGLNIPPTQTLLEILGITGLIFIVLEAALDLSIERKKIKSIGEAFISAAVILILNSLVIAAIFKMYYVISMRQALIHAVPLSVVSSAIAIPSVGRLDEGKREFIIYESTFSDVLGIIAFNYLSIDLVPGIATFLKIGWDVVLIFVISIGSTFVLLLLLKQSGVTVKFFLSFAVLILVYSFAKFLHLPSLIVVLCFGLVLKNISSLRIRSLARLVPLERLPEITKELKLITGETAFVIRTFFFLLFGYSVQLELLATMPVLLMGLGLVALTIMVRFFFLHFFLRIRSAPLTLIAPRGLITVILFYSIPVHLRIEAFSTGLLFIIIFATGIIMTIGLLLNKQNLKEKIDEIL